MSDTELYRVIVGAVASEKSYRLSEAHGQVVFEVLPTASKEDIARAVKLLFNVDVIAVNTSRLKGKRKRSSRGVVGVRKTRKRAYITVPAGQENNISVGD